MTSISGRPTAEMYASGLEIDCQCARCGSSCDWRECPECEDGYVCDDDDADWFDEDRPCQYCRGRGGEQWCLSSPESCQANPLPGRENVERGKIEWFTINSASTPDPAG
jgi:hypothetical protein